MNGANDAVIPAVFASSDIGDVVEKAVAGERLSLADGVRLFETDASSGDDIAWPDFPARLISGLHHSVARHQHVALGHSVLAVGDFDKSRLRLFEQLNDAGNQLSREAVVWVEEGDYTSGIHHMQVAIKKVVQGLQLLGIPLSMQ